MNDASRLMAARRDRKGRLDEAGDGNTARWPLEIRLSGVTRREMGLRWRFEVDHRFTAFIDTSLDGAPLSIHTSDGYLETTGERWLDQELLARIGRWLTASQVLRVLVTLAEAHA